MQFKNVIGIDMAKENFEIVLLVDGKTHFNLQVKNQTKTIETIFKKCEIDYSRTLFCLEHTGIYNNHLLNFLQEKNAFIWLENPVHIKRSLGLARGKNDKIDAMRIAKFAFHHQLEAKLWVPRRDVIESLKLLTGQRLRLMKAASGLLIPIKEAKTFIKNDHVKLLKETSKMALKGIKSDIQKVNREILRIIKSDSRLCELFSIVTSVPNIGTVVGASIIVSTNEFKSINDPRKFACHCGIAPFEHSSGTSVRGKTRVSHMADKTLKTLLHLAALGSTSRSGELRNYFERKVAEGKNKMSVINAIRNKLVHRVFACVRDQKKFINIT